MKGLRKRVTIGFLSIVTLLFISGMISLFELGHLSTDAESILNNSRRNMELGKEMLFALQEHDRAVSRIAVLGERDSRYDSLCMNSLSRLETSLLAAYDTSKSNAYLDSLTTSVSGLRILTGNLLASKPDSLDVARGAVWYETTYGATVSQITDQINGYMTFTYNRLAPRAEQLNHNAYRAVTPVLISLLVMIAIVLMLFYFITIYCVNPILGINKSLSDYLAFKLPFTVKAECNDELQDLKENIESLINAAKKNKA